MTIIVAKRKIVHVKIVIPSLRGGDQGGFTSICLTRLSRLPKASISLRTTQSLTLSTGCPIKWVQGHLTTRQSLHSMPLYVLRQARIIVRSAHAI